MSKQRKFVILFFLVLVICFNVSSALAVSELSLCPLCDRAGQIICPEGFEAICSDETANTYEPKCIFYGDKYIPGCWKFVGINKLNFDLMPANMPPSIMIDIIGGGETYTLNREIVGCKKL